MNIYQSYYRFISNGDVYSYNDDVAYDGADTKSVMPHYTCNPTYRLKLTRTEMIMHL